MDRLIDPGRINATLDGPKSSVRIADEVLLSIVTLNETKQGDAVHTVTYMLLSFAYDVD